MRISVVTKYFQPSIFEIKDLIKEAQKKKVEIEVLDVRDFKEVVNKKDWGDVIFWRSSSMGAGKTKTKSFRHLSKKGIFIFNSCLIKYPRTSYKDFQQKFFLANHSSRVNTIPTYYCKNEKDFRKLIEAGILTFPIVVKPKIGSQGKGIRILEKKNLKKELRKINFPSFLFQNFIKNDSDYRIIILGGKSLGIMRRVAKKGSCINNISQGGHAQLVKDAKLRQKLEKLALFIASSLELSICGVDIIQDLDSKKLFFMEINTAPEWKGFKRVTKKNVAKKIIEFGIKEYTKIQKESKC